MKGKPSLSYISSVDANSYSSMTITILGLPPEWTRGIDTAIMLALFMLWEVYCIRKFGITPSVNPSPTSVRPHIDNMGHLTGYFVGIAAGAIVRSTDPYWKDRERHHFLTEDFGKIKDSRTNDPQAQK